MVEEEEEWRAEEELSGRVILIQKISFLQLLHGFKLFHFVHRF